MSSERWSGLAERATAADATLVKIGEPYRYRLSDRNGYWVSSSIAGSEDHELEMFERMIELIEKNGVLT